MSDPTFRSRSNGEPRVSIDLEDIERRLRESLDPVAVPPPPAPAAAPASSAADPLAELARLVGSANADPFSKVFAQPAGIQSPPPVMPRAMPFEPPPVMPTSSSYDPAPFAAQPAYGQPAYAQPAYEPAQPEPAYEQGAYQHQPAYGEPAQDQAQAPWMAQERGAYDQYGDYAEEPPRRTGRAKLLIGAAIVVAAGGLAAAYALRGSGTMGDAPTIMANSGPVKVQPAKPVEDNSKPTISVLDRGANAPKDSKVVQSEEQPVDLGTAARTGAQRPQRAGEPGAPVTLAPPPPPPVANSLFAEPKKVKAVAVRPDGSIIDPNAPAAPAAPAAAAPAPAKPAAAPAASSKPNDMAALVASTTNAPAEPPKAAVRATDAKPAAAPAPAPVPAPRPAASAPMNLAPPVAAPAAPVQTATAAAGTYAVQLVGTTSADEAKAALDRVNARFRSDLGSYRPTIVKAEDGGRTVYRVRVINLSSDDANKLCAKLKSAGGTCFVARS
ncbi:MAG: hypothetical protein RIQ68_848 [Pseudomonadota bacterium]|jgi:hypothetical protein